MADNIDFEHIHYATHKRFAEMLREHNKWRRGEPPYDKAGVLPPFEPKELGVLIEEAARRIENIENMINSKEHGY